MTEDFKRTSVARVFVSELLALRHQEKPDSGQYAPTLSLLPSGVLANKVCICGTITEVDVEDTYAKARIVDGTAGINLMIGSFTPEVVQTLQAMELPAYAMVIGKPRLYSPDETVTYVNVAPDSITEVSRDTVDSWIAETAMLTANRIADLENSYKLGEPHANIIPPGVDCSVEDMIQYLKCIVHHVIESGQCSQIPSLPYYNSQDAPESKPQDAPEGKPQDTPDSTPPKEQQKPQDKPDSTPPKEPQKPEKTPKNSKQESAHQQAAKKAAKSPPPSDPAASNDELTETAKTAAGLLAAMCKKSDVGTVGANAFIDRLIADKLATTETATKLIARIMDMGCAYEPKAGRLKAV